jgi:hypothetical protein
MRLSKDNAILELFGLNRLNLGDFLSFFGQFLLNKLSTKLAQKKKEKKFQTDNNCLKAGIRPKKILL